MKHKILVVDDDKSILKVLKRFLEGRGFSVVITNHGSEALLLAQESKPDLILADVEIPGLDGKALCRVAKQETGGKIPVILMSGREIEEKDVLSGYDGGADDYILKPFSLPVLHAKIQAVITRYGSFSENASRIKECGIEIDPEGREAKVEGRALELTRKEFDLLATLLGRPGRALNVNYLLETVWGQDPTRHDGHSTVEVHISRLRKKLGFRVGKRIVSVTGHGYKFDPS